MSSLVPETLTYGALRRRVTRQLQEAFAVDGRIGTAALDARLIVAFAAERDPNSIAIFDALSVPPEAEAKVAGYVERRIAGEPVARILGEKEFWGLTFKLSRDTLVPRPDSETVVAAALGAVDQTGGRDRALRVLDLGTGTGALLIALLSELPKASGVGTDLAAGAVDTAKANAERLGVADRARFLQGNWADGLEGGFDLVVSNPPYVVSAEIERLPVEVWAFDPYLALDGGADGLAAYKAILSDMPRLLADSGRGFLEVGAGQATAVQDLASEAGFDSLTHADLAGIERVVELRRPQGDTVNPI
jgi:release factor glutamine methyltransferase